jgi:hypothetical protein
MVSSLFSLVASLFCWFVALRFTCHLVFPTDIQVDQSAWALLTLFELLDAGHLC